MRKENALDRFIKLYKDALIDTKIGLILGAGVSKASEVPDYSQTAVLDASRPLL